MTQQPPNAPERQMMIGLGAGVAVSLVVWGLGWNALDRSNAGGVVFIGVPALKVIVGFALLLPAKSRAIGAGVLISLAMGALIFFGSCFAHLRF